MSAEKTHNRGKGRPGLAGGERVKHVGLKMPAELEQRFIDRVKELKKLGFKTNKSHLIRTLAKYWLDHAEELDILPRVDRKNE